MKNETAAVRLDEYRPPNFRVDTVSLDFKLQPHTTQLRVTQTLQRNTGDDTVPLVLVGDDLKLENVTIDGRRLNPSEYSASPSELRIERVPNTFTLEIDTTIDPSANSELMGLFLSNGTYCTQCEAEGFRRMTYFLDRPDVLATYTTRIEADHSAAPVLLSNGNLVESGAVEGTGRHYAVWHDPFPKPSYLFALVAGELGSTRDSFTTMSGREVALAIYCEPGKEERCLYAMDSLKRAMRWDEEVFGCEYDLDVFNIVAVSDFNMGAMENKGLNVFNDRFILADNETATDADYGDVEGVVAHEYFHNWTGNRITCRDWFQLCLKEGLTVYRDQEFSSDMRSRAVKRIDDVRTLKARQFPEDAGPLAHPVRPEIYHEINNFYTATVYEKGAELVRMLHILFRVEGFRKGMDIYLVEHDGDAATVEDFLNAFAVANDIDLGQFKRWYSQAGTPELMARDSYDAAARRYTLSLAQTTPATPGQTNKLPLHIPVRFGLVGANGGDLAFESATGAEVRGDVIHLTEVSQTIVFEGISEKPVPSLLRGFSAPVRLSIDLSDADLTFLLRADTDPFNRWQAAQTLAMRTLVDGINAVREGKRVPDNTTLIQALGDVACNDMLDPALRAQILALPGEAEIAREIGRDVDPDAIAEARNALRAAIGRRLADQFMTLYATLRNDGPYRPDAEGQGRRSLRNTALGYLVAADAKSHAALALLQFEKASNMTDRTAALAALNATDAPERDIALAAFRTQYGHHPLVLDKWLAFEATSPRAETLDRVATLIEDRAFSIDNPNRVRALVGAFASANQTQFNRADGAGYDFVADVILRLDQKNAQLAARLLVAFRSWRALESTRRKAAESALNRIAATDPLSPDVRDIITRILA